MVDFLDPLKPITASNLYQTPQVIKLLDGYHIRWMHGEVAYFDMVAHRVHEKSGATYAEVTINHMYAERSLVSLQVNLSSKRGRDDLIRRMEELEGKRRQSDLDTVVNWPEIIELFCSEIIQRERLGEPGLILEPNEDKATHPGYYIEPVVTRGVPTVLFGDKGVAKTTLLLTLLSLIQTGLSDNPLELPNVSQGNVGLLDWESTHDLTLYTISRLRRGGSIPQFKLPYLRCESTLSDEIERIGNWIAENHITLVGIDSLGQAAGSDRFDSAGKGAALNFFKALRQLNVTSLIIAQNSKNEETNHKTIYGSTYFTYYTRSIFELKRSKNDSGDDMHLGLIHQESNYSKRYPPMGLSLAYSDTSITMVREPVNLSEFLDKVNKAVELLDFLKDGAKSIKAIAIAIELSEDRVRVMLSQQKKRGKVQNLSTGMWGLAVNG